MGSDRIMERLARADLGRHELVLCIGHLRGPIEWTHHRPWPRPCTLSLPPPSSARSAGGRQPKTSCLTCDISRFMDSSFEEVRELLRAPAREASARSIVGTSPMVEVAHAPW